MSTVSEVRRLPGCVRVLFEDGTYADVPTPLFQLFRVRPGDRIDPQQWHAGWEKQAYAFALERAAGLLSVRDATEHETAERLRRSGYPEETVSRVMRDLTQAGYVDDARFAGHFVESRSRRYGSRRIYGELRRKGVSEEQAREALGELSPEDEAESARRQAEKLLARKDASDPDVRRKAVQALVRRGYGWDAAREAVEAVLLEHTEENGGKW